LNAEFLIMILLIGFISVLAKNFKLLSGSGSAAAFFAGLLIYSGFGIKGLALLGTFFLTSSLLSKFKHRKKEHLGEIHEKGSARDWAQVAANGGTAALAGLANVLFPNPFWILPFSISLASANADTWASELGVLSKRDPVLIKNFKRVPRGTSGAVSGFGTASAAAGALLIALTACLLFKMNLSWVIAIFLLGLTGSLLDTILGAFIQAGYRCGICGLYTEKIVHCSVKTMRMTGSKWINNDAVNFLSCFSAAIAGMIIIGWSKFL
jgi:uncharacterized protein (TIGR00297 family)